MKEIVLKALEKLRKKNGGLLLPEKVIDSARSENSPLHKEFEWDESAAAHKYRIEQAEHLIRRYRIVNKDVERETHSFTVSFGDVPMYSPGPFTRGYMRTADLLAGPERKEFLLAEYRRLDGHLQRWCAYLQEVGLQSLAEAYQRSHEQALSELDSLSETEAGH